MLRLSAWGLICCLVISPAFAQDKSTAQTLDARQKALDNDRELLRSRIQSMQTQLETRDVARQQATDQLKLSEAAISKIIRQIKLLEVDLKKSKEQLKTLATEVQAQRKVMLLSRDRLAAQLRAQYSSGLSPWSALLAGENPQALGRELGYLDYVARARTEAIQTLTNDVARLNELEQAEKKRRDHIESNVKETDSQKQALLKQRKERSIILARIEDDIRLQKAQMSRLGQNEKRLSDLVDALEVQLQAQRQAEKKAAIATKEASRQAEVAQARQQAEINQRNQNIAREQNKTQPTAVEQSTVERSEPKPDPGEKSDQLLAKDQTIDQEREAQHVKVQRAQTRAEQEKLALARKQAVLSTLPDGGGIKRGMSPPVPGKVVARFGTNRPDGGTWRGLLLTADEGAAVNVVAPGTVVYSTWLRGFGNIVIIDHGDEFLTIYAFNQSLLKQVGDVVKKGETIALAGNTGGQLDSALYFEIRHKGAPIDPLLYISY
jgi:septal ring factor EnvC (AmiA/AmiB activator)